MAIDDINNKTDGIFDVYTQLRSVLRSPRQLFKLGVEAASDMVLIDDEKGVMACVGPYSAKSTFGEFDPSFIIDVLYM